jgi:hypothetical protein
MKSSYARDILSRSSPLVKGKWIFRESGADRIVEDYYWLTEPDEIIDGPRVLAAEVRPQIHFCAATLGQASPP